MLKIKNIYFDAFKVKNTFKKNHAPQYQTHNNNVHLVLPNKSIC